MNNKTVRLLYDYLVFQSQYIDQLNNLPRLTVDDVSVSCRSDGILTYFCYGVYKENVLTGMCSIPLLYMKRRREV